MSHSPFTDPRSWFRSSYAQTLAVFVGLAAMLPLYVNISLATAIVILGLLALSFNLLWGYTGILSFGHALYFGAGAYLAGHLVVQFGYSMVVILVFVTGLMIGLSAVIGFVCLQREDLFFAILTFAFAQVGYLAVLQFPKLTGGYDGFGGIYRTSLLGLGLIDVGGDLQFYYFVVGVVLLVLIAFVRLLNSAHGVMLRGINENEERLSALGVNTFRVKLLAFTVSGLTGGLAGYLWAFYIRYLDPGVLHWSISGDIILYALVGGMNTLLGPLVGAGVILSLENSLFEQQVGLQNVIIGAIFILAVLFVNKGVYGSLVSLTNRVWELVSDRLGSEETPK